MWHNCFVNPKYANINYYLNILQMGLPIITVPKVSRPQASPIWIWSGCVWIWIWICLDMSGYEKYFLAYPDYFIWIWSGYVWIYITNFIIIFIISRHIQIISKLYPYWSHQDMYGYDLDMYISRSYKKIELRYYGLDMYLDMIWIWSGYVSGYVRIWNLDMIFNLSGYVIWICLDMSGYDKAYPYGNISGYVWICMDMTSGYVWICLDMYI